jgi:hypothetical protein
MEVHTLEKSKGLKPDAENGADDERRDVIDADVAVGDQAGTRMPSAPNLQKPPRTQPAAG